MSHVTQDAPVFIDAVNFKGARKLPFYKGYVVDVRLRQFRKIERNQPWEFISFYSQKGDQLLAELISYLPANHPLCQVLMDIALGQCQQW
jgi:hypothetical protein